MRLIDADALKARLFDYYECVNSNTSKKTYKGETLMAYEVSGMIEDCLDNAPTITPRKPCKTGEWIEKPYLLGTTRFCSECGENYGMPHGIFKFCPNCGAKMVGN